MQYADFTYSNFLINFLINPKNRFYRHLLLVLFFAIIALNASFLTYWEEISQLKGTAILISIGLLMAYLVCIYLNIYVLVPLLLLKKRYISYLILFAALILLLVFSELISEYLIRMYYHIAPGKFSSMSSIIILQLIATAFLYGLCVAGSSVTVLLQNWFISAKRVNELEKASLQSELEQLKTQINPNFLFSVLEKAGTLTSKSPERTSKILMKLSKLLRYQLYDSSRNKVLLNAEITFLDNFLNLEKDRRNGNGFLYNISSIGEINRTLVPPLLLIPFVVYAIGRIDKNEKDSFVELSFRAENGQLDFTCTGTKTESVDSVQSLDNVKRRLDLLYGSDYTLRLEETEEKHSIYLHLNL